MPDTAFDAALVTATAELARRDPVMAQLAKQAGPSGLGQRRGQRSNFWALCESVAYQQLAGKAAAAIFGRFVEAVGGEVTPERVLALSEAELRAPGLSGAKARCIRALAERAASGELALEALDDLPDDEIVAALSAVPGIGRWTAEMFLLFQLGRLDVWPVGDYGVRKGYALAYGLPELPSPKELAALGERFRPYRSVAAWYCWRAVEAVTPGGRA
jgi:3-methyladenine DNA glycosylase/8-oxoguanine DNA glycosylase